MRCATQAITFVPPEDTKLLDVYKRWSIAFSSVLMCHLREDEDLNAKLQVCKHTANCCI